MDKRTDKRPEWRKLENYPEHLRQIVQVLFQYEDHLSDGFGWYMPYVDVEEALGPYVGTKQDGLKRIAQALYEAVSQGRS